MKRKVLIFGLLWLMLFGCPLISWGQQKAPVKKKVDLKVIYVGQVDTDRTKAFVKLLSDNFSQVEMLDQEKFEAEKTAEFDVVVLDYVRVRRPRGEQGTQAARTAQGAQRARGAQRAQGVQRTRDPGLQLPEGYSKPTVVFGSFGMQAARTWLEPTSFYT